MSAPWVAVRRNTNSAEYKAGRAYTIETMKFSEYIDNMKALNKKALSSYLAVQNMPRALPQLEVRPSAPLSARPPHPRDPVSRPT